MPEAHERPIGSMPDLSRSVPFLQEDASLTRSITEKLQQTNTGFSDLESAHRQLEEEISLEVTLDRTNFLPVAFLRQGVERSRSVCMVKAEGTNYRGESGRWHGTGFMVAPNILLTNHHVLNNKEVASRAYCVFNYENDSDGKSLPTTAFHFDPERLFLTSPVDGGLDYTFVWVSEDPSVAFGHLRLSKSFIPVRTNDFSNIIQHPDGAPKVVVLQENTVTGISEAIVHYAADTEPGSSGSPVFDNAWNLVALHHASRTLNPTVVNEGILLSAIATDLEQRALHNPTERAMAEAVLGQFKDVNPLLGFFGSLGRPELPKSNGLETVVESYRGNLEDIDVGFWNVEWFTRNPQKVPEVATVVRDMNLDIWAFVEASPEVTEMLVQELKNKHGLDFDWAASEPAAPAGKQSTTVIWNKETLAGVKEEWPQAIAPWFEVDSRKFGDLNLEAVEGKVFDRYPGLFHFRATDRAERTFDFYLVPLHLKAMDEGSKRRQMASKVLAAAVKWMTTHGYGGDWVIGGDYNAELATGDFSGLLGSGFVAISAEDEAAGAFSYVSQPKSLIDHIFLSANLSTTFGPDDYFVVAEDKTIPGYIERLSDHRPVLVRMSLKAVGEDERKVEGIKPPKELLEMLNAVGSIQAKKKAKSKVATP